VQPSRGGPPALWLSSELAVCLCKASARFEMMYIVAGLDVFFDQNHLSLGS
jgi:hypothetical protein